MHDRALARGIRIETLIPLLSQTCADPRQLLFGMDDDTRRDLAYARDSLARFPSERLWVESLGQMMDGTVTPPADFRGGGNGMATLPGMIDGIVGGHRFENCVLFSPVFAQRF